jgi:hypothetical protein
MVDSFFLLIGASRNPDFYDLKKSKPNAGIRRHDEPSFPLKHVLARR